MAEGFEPCDQAAGLAFGVQAAGEVVGAELVTGLSGGQDYDDGQGVGHHDDGFLLRGRAAVAAMLHDVPVVEGLEVAVVADRSPGTLDQDRLQVRVAPAALAGLAACPGTVTNGSLPAQPSPRSSRRLQVHRSARYARPGLRATRT